MFEPCAAVLMPASLCCCCVSDAYALERASAVIEQHTLNISMPCVCSDSHVNMVHTFMHTTILCNNNTFPTDRFYELSQNARARERGLCFLLGFPVVFVAG